MEYICLNDIAKYKQGKQVSIDKQHSTCLDGMVRFVRIVDYTNSNEMPRYIENLGQQYIVDEKSIVMIRYGSQTAGKVVRGISGIIANNMFQISIDDDRFDNDYMYYFLSSSVVNQLLMGGQSSSTMPAITFGMLKQIQVPVRSIDEQRKIASFLESIDKKIENNNKINDNLQLQLTAIFREWFIDAPKSAEWPRGTFADLIDHTISGDWGKDAPTGNYTEMVYCIRGADIPEVKAGNKGKMPTRYILPKNYAAKKLVDGDIVVEISGGSPTQSTGRAAPVSESLLRRYDRGMVCTNFCKAIKPKRGYSMFVYYYWQHLYDAGVFFGYENGTTGIKNLDITGFIETEEIVLPPLDIVERFDTICQTIASKVYANGLENERLANLRDTLLPKFMTGEVDISSIQI